jgi:hypothetical protein
MSDLLVTAAVVACLLVVAWKYTMVYREKTPYVGRGRVPILPQGLNLLTLVSMYSEHLWIDAGAIVVSMVLTEVMCRAYTLSKDYKRGLAVHAMVLDHLFMLVCLFGSTWSVDLLKWTGISGDYSLGTSDHAIVDSVLARTWVPVMLILQHANISMVVASMLVAYKQWGPQAEGSSGPRDHWYIAPQRLVWPCVRCAHHLYNLLADALVDYIYAPWFIGSWVVLIVLRGMEYKILAVVSGSPHRDILGYAVSDLILMLVALAVPEEKTPRRGVVLLCRSVLLARVLPALYAVWKTFCRKLAVKKRG